MHVENKEWDNWTVIRSQSTVTWQCISTGVDIVSTRCDLREIYKQNIHSGFVTKHACDRQMDRQTEVQLPRPRQHSCSCSKNYRTTDGISQIQTIIIWHSVVRKWPQKCFLTIFGLVVTLTFDLLIPKSNQFHLCSQMQLSCTFGEILLSTLWQYEISSSPDRLINAQTDTLKT